MESKLEMLIHEIRNPLTSILLANQSLRAQVATNPSLEIFTDIIIKNAHRIEKTVREILAPDDGKRVPMQSTDVCDVIEKSLSEAKDRIYLKKIKIVRIYDFGLKVQANMEELSIAFLNLIVNAIEAVKDEAGKIWITVYRARDEVKVIFKDNGSGMEPEVASHIFDKCFSTKSDGLGIGLTNARRILEHHSAGISVHSEPGTGTAIIVNFRGDAHDAAAI